MSEVISEASFEHKAGNLAQKFEGVIAGARGGLRWAKDAVAEVAGSKPVRVALSLAIGAGSVLISPGASAAGELEKACQAITAERDDFAPHGIKVGTYPVRMPEPGSSELIDQNIFAINRNREAHWVTYDPGFDEEFPSLSPDGQKVVFSRNGPVKVDWEKYRSFHEYTGYEGLHTVNIDGSDGQRLTSTSPDMHDTFLSWSPDGSKIAFVRKFYGILPMAVLFSINSDGTNMQALAVEWEEGAPSIFFPKYSPDGKKIAYQTWTGTYTIDADGKNKKMISKGPGLEDPMGRDRDFEWTDDGELYITKQYRVSNIELRDEKFLVSADGSGYVNLTAACPTPNLTD